MVNRILWLLNSLGAVEAARMVLGAASRVAIVLDELSEQVYVHKGHDMKLPLSFRATFRMKEFYDYKTEMYHGAFLWGASAQEAPTKDIQHDYRRDAPGTDAKCSLRHHAW